MILVFRVELLYNLVILWERYTMLLMSDFGDAIQLLDFSLFDAILSVKLFIIIPVILLLFRKRIYWLKEPINFSSLILLLLLIAFLLAPLVTDENPEFQKDLKATKLLSPLSTVKILHLNKKEKISN